MCLRRSTTPVEYTLHTSSLLFLENLSSAPTRRTCGSSAFSVAAQHEHCERRRRDHRRLLSRNSAPSTCRATCLNQTPVGILLRDRDHGRCVPNVSSARRFRRRCATVGDGDRRRRWGSRCSVLVRETPTAALAKNPKNPQPGFVFGRSRVTLQRNTAFEHAHAAAGLRLLRGKVANFLLGTITMRAHRAGARTRRPAVTQLVCGVPRRELSILRTRRCCCSLKIRLLHNSPHAAAVRRFRAQRGTGIVTNLVDTDLLFWLETPLRQRAARPCGRDPWRLPFFSC